MIKDSVGATDDDVSTPYPRFNEPYVTRNSVNEEREIYIPIDADSEEDFDQDDYKAYAGGSLKNY